MSRIAVIAFIISSGCAVSADDALDTAEVESAITITPAAGTWFYEELGPVETTCQDGPVQGEGPGPFTLSNVTATSFYVVPSDGTPSFTCSYNSTGRFDCPNRGTATIDLRPGTDAVVSVQAFVTGLMSDGQHALGKQDALATCTGSQCSQVAPFPCGFVVNFEVYKQ